MKKILIVEDEQAYVKLLRTRLETSYQVFDAPNGKKGLELVKKEHPDLILLDIIMPVMDGLTMLKELQENHHGKLPKVILLTNLEASTSITSQTSSYPEIEYYIKSDIELNNLIDKINRKIPRNK